MDILIMEKVTKTYQNTNVLKPIDLRVKKGEFVTLLGPSGCGKTTTLRIIAGLETPTSGKVLIGNKTVSSPKEGIFIAPEKRNIGMVFQSYAVWPHMTVLENVAYPLKIRKIDKITIEEKVKNALKLVRLNNLENRYPHQLSGGQQQRVALARALVMNPEIMLLDEPLSNLDAKLREEMRYEIKELQEKTGITIIYVTHDQTEAMSMSDRIVVMKDGEVRQIGTPTEIYEKPKDTFVADFIGSANFIEPEKLEKTNGGTKIHFLNTKITSELTSENIQIVIRPTDITITTSNEENSIEGIVISKTFLGESLLYKVALKNGAILKVFSTYNIQVNNRIFIKIKKAIPVIKKD
ncbi:ABC transporter ATP-binding protein [Desulfurobacterium sp.]